MPNENVLMEAKARFYRGVLANDTLAQLVLVVLNNDDGTDVEVRQLPDFMAEPWRPIEQESGAAKLAMRISLSSTTRQEVLSATFATYKYLEVLIMTTSPGDRTLLSTDDPYMFFDGSDALMELEVDDVARRQAALHFMQLWQEFCQIAEMLGAHLDPMSDTFTTEVRSYGFGG